MSFRSIIESSWHSKSPLTYFLLPLSWLYRVGVRANQQMFRMNLRRSRSVSVPVVCVGNLTVGGVGKTPLVQHVARFLIDEGHRVAIVSRGYKRSDERRIVVVSEGAGPLVGVKQSGDEPWMLARQLPEAIVVVGADRTRASERAVELGAEVIVLDDGLQHLRIKRNINICVFDAGDPWGNSQLLPAGPLREPSDGLNRVDFIFLSRARDTDIELSLADIQTQTEKTIPFASGDLVPTTLKDLTQGWETIALSSIREKRVLAFSGIGTPSAFEKTLRDIDCEVVSSIVFDDHHAYSEEDMLRIEKQAHKVEADLVVTTIKDAVRLDKLLEKLKPGIGLFALEVRLEILDGEERLAEMLRTCF